MLREYLETTVEQRLDQASGTRIQPVFVGPPLSTLRELFELLTNEGKADWTIETISGPMQVVVLLIGARSSAATSNCRSQISNWDYAVSIRNSARLSLTLVAPSMWDSRPESMANATDTIGAPPSTSAEDHLESEPWPALVDEIAQRLLVSTAVVRMAIRLVSAEGRNRLPQDREEFVWLLANRLLGSQSGNDLPLQVGLPNIENPLSVDELKRATDVLRRLSTLCGEAGFDSAERHLVENLVSLGLGEEEDQSVKGAIKAMMLHLRAKAGTGPQFSSYPTHFFRTDRGSDWWSILTSPVLDRLLERKPPPRTARLRVTIVGQLNNPPLTGEPAVVKGLVSLLIPVEVGTVRISRSLPRQRFAERWTGTGGWQETPPDHNAPINYRVEADGFLPWSASIVALDTYGLGAFSRIDDALSNPVAIAAGQDPEQLVVLDRPGVHRLRVYCSDDVSQVTISNATVRHEHTNQFVANIDCEHADEFRIETLGGHGLKKSWLLRTTVKEPTGSQPTSRFEALVLANQRNESHVRPVAPLGSIKLRQIESFWLNDDRSWRGVIAAWSRDTEDLGTVNWELGTLGDLPFGLDVRPPLSDIQPPRAYLDSRGSVVKYLRDSGNTIAELDLGNDELRPLISNYLHSFIQWTKLSPSAALWSDCLAIHAPIKNPQARQDSPTHEPIALLMTPLHPVRLGWHSVAQTTLNEALATHRCPSAGMVNPHAVPLCTALELFESGRSRGWRAFLGSGANDPHWALFWNRNYLRPSQERTDLLSRLQWLGLEPRAITPGFTEAQAQRSLQAVADILPTRVSLRVGLIGSTHESDACVEGVLNWCRSALTDDAGYSVAPHECRVYDLRDEPARPTAAVLANVGEQTNERVKWFRGEPANSSSMDVVILDQLGTLEPQGVSGRGHSVITPNSLYRLNIRNDISGGLLLQETRIAHQASQSDIELEANLQGCVAAIESRVPNDQGTSVLEFRPNQDAIQQRLAGSLFVATTSSQIDPACLIRGVRAHRAYLWDYDLPGIVGLNEERAGYYLVANPPAALSQAMSAAVSLVSETSHEISELLDEVSRRGIPLLKRMAAGGNQARGEVGVLLAVRFLQDAFRPGATIAPHLPISTGERLNLILPVDPYWDQLSELRRGLKLDRSEQRPDLLVFSILCSNGSQVRIQVTPIEVKFRTERMSNLAMSAALQQAASLGHLLTALWTNEPSNELWKMCGRALLAQCLDHCFRIYGDESLHLRSRDEWLETHESVLSAVLSGECAVDVVETGRSIILDASQFSVAQDFDGDGKADTVVLSKLDAGALMDGKPISAQAFRARELLTFGLSAETLATPAPSETTVTKDKHEATSTTEDSPTDPEAVDAFGQAEELRPLAQQGTELDPQDTQRTDPIDPEIRTRVRDAFSGFIGNNPAVRRISNDLIRALIEHPPHLSKNYLFTGQPSTGKTELARRMAHALGLPLVRLDGRGVASRDRLFDLIKQELEGASQVPAHVGQSMGMPTVEYPPMVVFIDEVHLLPTPVQESFLTMLEAGDRRVALRDHVALVHKATFLFATTRASELDAAFRSRCAEVALKEYDLAEVATILERRFGDSNWDPAVFLGLARLGRMVPRVAIEFSKELETEIAVSEHQERSPIEHLDQVRMAREVDEEGFTKHDFDYLSVLDSEGRPVGEAALINILGTVDRERVTNEIEPFLRRRQLIKFGARGREITRAGKEYLAASRHKPL